MPTNETKITEAGTQEVTEDVRKKELQRQLTPAEVKQLEAFEKFSAGKIERKMIGRSRRMAVQDLKKKYEAEFKTLSKKYEVQIRKDVASGKLVITAFKEYDED